MEPPRSIKNVTKCGINNTILQTIGSDRVFPNIWFADRNHRSGNCSNKLFLCKTSPAATLSGCKLRRRCNQSQANLFRKLMIRAHRLEIAILQKDIWRTANPSRRILKIQDHQNLHSQELFVESYFEIPWLWPLSWIPLAEFPCPRSSGWNPVALEQLAWHLGTPGIQEHVGAFKKQPTKFRNHPQSWSLAITLWTK